MPTFLRRLIPVGVALTMCLIFGMFVVSADRQCCRTNAAGRAVRLPGRSPQRGTAKWEDGAPSRAFPCWNPLLDLCGGCRGRIGGYPRIGSFGGRMPGRSPRDDSLTLRPALGGDGPQYAPFALQTGQLEYDHAMAPMGCAADIDEDGSVDLIVYYWGRSPIIFLNNGVAPRGVRRRKPRLCRPAAMVGCPLKPRAGEAESALVRLRQVLPPSRERLTMMCELGESLSSWAAR